MGQEKAEDGSQGEKVHAQEHDLNTHGTGGHWKAIRLVSQRTVFLHKTP